MERSHHNTVHLVVSNMANLTEVDWVDNLIETVFLVAVKILGLASMTYGRVRTVLHVNVVRDIPE